MAPPPDRQQSVQNPIHYFLQIYFRQLNGFQDPQTRLF